MTKPTKPTKPSRPTKPTKPRQPGYDWYREQRVRLRSEYPYELNFKIPPPGKDFTNAQKATIARLFERENTKYFDAYEKLKDYHDFSFKKPRGKKDFAPQQKAAITRKLGELIPVIQKINKGDYTAVKIKKGKQRKVPKKIVDDFKHTNKVVIIPEKNSRIIIKKKGRQLKYTIESKTPEKMDGIKRQALYIPAPSWVYNDPTKIPYFMLWLTQQYPCYVFRPAYRGKMFAGQIFTANEFGYFQNRMEVYGLFDGHKSGVSGIWAIKYSCKDLDAFYGINQQQIEQDLIDQIFSEFGDDDPMDTLDQWIDTD